MDVVGHQCIGVDAATGLASVFGQPFKIQAVIRVREEASLAVVSGLDQMERNAQQSKARAARHGVVRQKMSSWMLPETVVCPLLFII